MPSDIVPQVEVGSLALRGLSGFVPLLAAFTADDVAPLAMIQLESLGSVFHINGEHASKVPDLLQRCPSKRLDNLAIIIGWRKGDAASTMAQSAGGQAVALLSLCLRSLYSYEDTGSILYHISQRAIPKTLAISSIGQLACGADLLASKLSNIGFGNILAKVVLKIQSVYTAIGISCPQDFFDSMTQEAVVDLLYSLSRVFCEEDCIVRISGTQAMGCIVTIVSVLFAEDFVLVIEGLIVQQGSRQSISLEIGPSSQTLSATSVSVEKRLHGQPISDISIIVDPNAKLKWAGNCSFKWNGHLSDALQLGFSDSGITCSPDLHVACCDLLAIMANSVEGRALGRNDTALPEGGLSGMLGATPLQHTYHTYKTVFRVSASNQPLDVKSAYENLTQAFRSTMGGHTLCSCHECDLARVWSQPSRYKIVKNCIFRLLWHHIAQIICHGLCCVLIEPNTDATIPFMTTADPEFSIASKTLRSGLGLIDGTYFVSCETLHQDVLRTLVSTVQTGDLAVLSNGSVTLVPKPLLRMQMDFESGTRYSLCEGQLLFSGRYYRNLQCVPSNTRKRAQKSLRVAKNQIAPSSHGEHSYASFSVKESMSNLELRTTLLVSGQNVPINLTRTLVASMGVTDAGSCEHAHSVPLAAEFEQDVCTTSVASPRAANKKIAVVQTMHNPSAQLFACEPVTRSLIQRDCCLNCALAKCKAGGFDQVIVGL